MQSLFECHPMVKKVLGAAGYYIKKGVYPRYPNGRPSDAFLYVVEGTLIEDFGDYTLEIKTGELLYIAKGATFTITVLQERCGVLQMDFLLDVPEGTRLKSELVKPHGGRNIEYRFRTAATAWQMMHHAREIECLAALYSVYHEFLNAGHSSYSSPVKKQKMEDAAEYIDAHISEETLGVKQIASVFSMSDSYFRHMFKEIHNISVSEYIHKRRIRIAKNLLQFSNDSLTSIAKDLGFSSLYYFSSAFKKEVKMSPSEYRKRRQPKS